MFITIKKDEIEDLQELVDRTCRPHKREAVLALAHKVGDDLINSGSDLKLTLTEMQTVLDLASEVFALSVDKYEDMMYEFFHDTVKDEDC